MHSGLLVYLMGPSGAGKDSVIDAAREGLAALGVEVVQRVITRSPESLGERALGATPEAFAQMRQEGAFALCWSANGLWYGIPTTIDACMAAGGGVLVNGSRAHLPQALARYPGLLAIMLEVRPEVLRVRLLKRGREPLASIEARLARSGALLEQSAQWQGEGVVVHRLDNSGELATTAEALLALINNAIQRS